MARDAAREGRPARGEARARTADRSGPDPEEEPFLEPRNTRKTKTEQLWQLRRWRTSPVEVRRRRNLATALAAPRYRLLSRKR